MTTFLNVIYLLFFYTYHSLRMMREDIDKKTGTAMRAVPELFWEGWLG